MSDVARVQWNGARVGAIIGAVGGLAFLLVNSWPFPEPYRSVITVAVVLWFLWTVWEVLRVPDDPDAVRPDARQLRTFWIVVAVEVVLIVGGAQLFIRVLDNPSASLPWIATVLGVHWLVFRSVFREDVFLWLGTLTLTCGLTGLLVALTGVAEENTAAAIAIASGFLVGVVMLGAVLIDARRRRAALVSRTASRRPRGRST
jgi:hypothetical protein